MLLYIIERKTLVSKFLSTIKPDQFNLGEQGFSSKVGYKGKLKSLIWWYPNEPEHGT